MKNILLQYIGSSSQTKKDLNESQSIIADKGSKNRSKNKKAKDDQKDEPKADKEKQAKTQEAENSPGYKTIFDFKQD